MAALSTEEIVDAISSMTVLEVSKLVKIMEERFGVSAAAPVAVAVGGAAAAAPVEPVEEKTEFNVILKALNEGAEKVKVIKEVRAITGLGLKEAKELVESAPKTLKENVSKEDAAKIKEQITAVGGVIDIQ